MHWRKNIVLQGLFEEHQQDFFYFLGPLKNTKHSLFTVSMKCCTCITRKILFTSKLVRENKAKVPIDAYKHSGDWSTALNNLKSDSCVLILEYATVQVVQLHQKPKWVVVPLLILETVVFIMKWSTITQLANPDQLLMASAMGCFH